MASSRSSSSNEQRVDHVVRCQCNRPAKVVKAWTDHNPGRRFYTCQGQNVGTGYMSCNFFQWFDIEKPNGWQKEALIEARNVMNRQREELKSLKEIIGTFQREREGGSFELTQTGQMEDEVTSIREECEKLKRQVLILTERSTVYRNVLITSSIGFTVIIGVLTGLWKQ